MLSPRLIVSQILTITPPIVNNPQSVVDFGCGLGTWLRAFQEHGVPEVLGLDGHWCNTTLLHKNLSPSAFREVDLESPIHLDKTYDLVLSLEVAEHLSSTKADVFVESLVRAGQVILFSAAIPGQGGWKHINERWPSYWAEKFDKHDYIFHDILRGMIWDNDDIEPWYRQNIFFVAHKSISIPPSTPTLSQRGIIDLVHPYYFTSLRENITKIERGERGVTFYFPTLLKSIINRLKKI
jgi:SAM-dependent methyltransferase